MFFLIPWERDDLENTKPHTWSNKSIFRIIDLNITRRELGLDLFGGRDDLLVLTGGFKLS